MSTEGITTTATTRTTDIKPPAGNITYLPAPQQPGATYTIQPHPPTPRT